MSDIKKDYNIIAFDAQYYLHRNLCALKSRTGYSKAVPVECSDGVRTVTATSYNFTEHDLVKQFIYSIVTFIRDHHDANKFILLWDTPPYHKTSILSDFKSGRHHYCQELLDQWDKDEDPEGYAQEYEDYLADKMKQKASRWIVDHLGQCGFPSVKVSGFEADDLAYIFSHHPSLKSDQKSAIVSADSDWLYWISPNVDWISYISSKKCDVWTYDDGMSDGEGVYEELNLNLFEAKMWMDSTFMSHNDLFPTTEYGWADFRDLVKTARLHDFQMYSDVNRFFDNMRSFEMWNYPNINEALESITSAVNDSKLGGESEISILYSMGFKVSMSYMIKFINLMDPISYIMTSFPTLSEDLRSQWISSFKRPTQVENLKSENLKFDQYE